MNNIIPLRVRKNRKGTARRGKTQQIQITIPVEIRRQYGIEPGDTLLMLANQKEIRLFTKEEYMKRLAD
jgi:AbrB family looped-hinge helix DNA binding protein